MQSFLSFFLFFVVGANARILKFTDESPMKIVNTTRNEGKPERIDCVEALILPKHLKNDGNSADMSNEKLQDAFNQVKEDGDMPGLLVPWQFGGPPTWFNSIPENIRVNPGEAYPALTTDWYKIECTSRKWLEAGGDHEVKWIAEPQYDDDSYRPSKVNLQVQFLPSEQKVTTSVHNPKMCEDSMIFTSKQCVSDQCSGGK